MFIFNHKTMKKSSRIRWDLAKTNKPRRVMNQNLWKGKPTQLGDPPGDRHRQSRCPKTRKMCVHVPTPRQKPPPVAAAVHWAAFQPGQLEQGKQSLSQRGGLQMLLISLCVLLVTHCDASTLNGGTFAEMNSEDTTDSVRPNRYLRYSVN